MSSNGFQTCHSTTLTTHLSPPIIMKHKQTIHSNSKSQASTTQIYRSTQIVNNIYRHHLQTLAIPNTIVPKSFEDGSAARVKLFLEGSAAFSYTIGSSVSGPCAVPRTGQNNPPASSQFLMPLIRNTHYVFPNSPNLASLQSFKTVQVVMER